MDVFLPCLPLLLLMASRPSLTSGGRLLAVFLTAFAWFCACLRLSCSSFVLLGVFVGQVPGRIYPVAGAMVPYHVALALVSAAELLESASSAVDGSESGLHPQLHPSGFVRVVTSYAA